MLFLRCVSKTRRFSRSDSPFIVFRSFHLSTFERNSKHYKFNIGLCAVILIVLLRIAIGWHYFYEGIHKFDPSHDFSAKGFLGMAKGPVAPLYYEMLPDLKGIKRLEVGPAKDDQGNVIKEKGREVRTFTVFEKAWKDYYASFVRHHSLNDPDKAEAKKQTDAIFTQYLKSLRDGAADSEADIEAFKASLQRYEQMSRSLRNNAEFEQVRRWDAMMAYRAEAGTWVNMLNGMSDGLQSDLARVISPQLAGEKGNIVTGPEKPYIPNPIVKTHMETLDYAVMYGLTAIGLCLMLGFCTKLACLGGAAFLVNVILTTWPVPGVHPPFPAAVGNFLFITKDGIELIAMLMLAVIPSGRWAGLDYFLWNFGGKKICVKLGLGKYFDDCREDS